jgi:cation:H+ antiporter
MEHVLSLWTFAVIIAAAFLIAWGAECAQFYVSQGLALALLAWMQTLPEFAVEAVIAFQAGQNPDMMHLVTANFTGSLRLFVGLGWPMVFFIGYFASQKNRKQAVIHLEPEHAVTVVAFLPVLAYMLLIYFKGTLNWVDGLVLFGLYGTFMFWLSKMPVQEMESVEDLGGVPRRIMALRPMQRGLTIVGCFLLGILILITCAHPFLESMLHLALILGISQFVFVQWIAPILSEFPEKVSAFYWAKTNRGSMGLINFVSSCVNQWTMLIGMVPFIVAFGAKSFTPVVFDEFQRIEIMLTILQGFLGMIFLLNMEFRMYEAAGLFVLWIVQFIVPDLRAQMQYVYGAWVAVEAVRFAVARSERNAFRIFTELSRTHVFGPKG